MLRSGERVSGELVDMGGAGFQVRVGGASRQIPTGDVAVIDFSGSTSFPDSEVNQIQAGKHLIVLSSGQVVSGNLYDVGGTQPKRISVHTDTGNRDFSSNEVRRIYLARPSGARAATPLTPAARGRPSTLPATGGQIRVPAQPALDRHRASPCAGASASRSTRAAKCSSSSERQRHGRDRPARRSGQTPKRPDAAACSRAR